MIIHGLPGVVFTVLEPTDFHGAKNHGGLQL